MIGQTNRAFDSSLSTDIVKYVIFENSLWSDQVILHKNALCTMHLDRTIGPTVNQSIHPLSCPMVSRDVPSFPELQRVDKSFSEFIRVAQSYTVLLRVTQGCSELLSVAQKK